jgi:hypothetical protein
VKKGKVIITVKAIVNDGEVYTNQIEIEVDGEAKGTAGTATGDIQLSIFITLAIISLAGMAVCIRKFRN